MGLLDRFFKKSAQTTKPNTGIFSFLMGTAAPDMKGVEYLGAYKGWVYACVNAIAEDVATVDLRLQRLSSAGWTDIQNHIAETTLYDVNPFMTSSELILYTQSFLELEGNAFWYLPRGQVTRKPAEIWLLDPHRVTVVKSNDVFINGYVYKNERNESIPFKTEDILHFKRFNPLSKYRGMGTVQAAALSIDIDTYSAQFNRNFFFNSAMPSATLETDGTITKEQLERIKAEWDSRYKGVDNAHKLAILQGGLHFNPVQLSQKDMEFLEQRKFTRDEIMGIFRVPKTILGITEDVNRANAEATEYVFSKRVIKPRMEFIVDRLNEFYLQLFGLDQKEYRFTFTDPTPQNVELKLKANETGLRAGYLTINEVREEEGRDAIDGGDVVYLPANLLPISIPKKAAVDNQKQFIKENKDEDPEVEKRVRFIEGQIVERTQVYKNIFLDQKARVVRALQGKKSKKGTEEEDLIDKVNGAFDDEFASKVEDASKEALETSFVRAGKLALASLEIDLPFNVTHERAVSWLRENALSQARSVVGTLKDEMRERITTGVKEGLGVNDITGNLAEFFDEQSEWRALRIARTEVVAGYAEGSLEGYRQSGIVRMKRWLSASDPDSLCALNIQDGAIPLNASFSSGHSAPPAHPNCRCTLVPEVGN
jgi:HK97 family phage portal protein